MSHKFFDHDNDDLIELFEGGEIDVEGRMPFSSNATLLVNVTDPDEPDTSVKAIYKPGQGERPLWDFPENLYRREVAMYRLSEALDLDVIPPTALAVGPYGEGSVQAFVDAQFDEHYFTLYEEGRGIDDLQSLCVLDLIANNTDRKSGHCLLGRNGRVYGIDHGLAFHAQWKLRTVIWEFVGEPIAESLLESIGRFIDDGPSVELACLLDPLEQDAMMTRAKAVLRTGVFPEDDTDGHRYPWPLV